MPIRREEFSVVSRIFQLPHPQNSVYDLNQPTVDSFD